MEEICNNTWTKLFGFEVGREMKEMVLNEIKETGQPIEKVVSQYALAPSVILEDDGTFWDNGKHYFTAREWANDSALKEFSKLVVIGTAKSIEQYKKLNAEI